MKIILIYFLLFSFWAENSLGFSSIVNVKGLSLPNLSLYLLLLGWTFTSVFKRKLLEWSSVNTYLIILIFFVILSIPYKILLDEIPYVGLKSDFVALKNWVEPFFIFFILFNIIDDKKTCKGALFGLMILLLITSVSTPLISLKIVNFGHYTFYQGRATAFGSSGEFAAFLVLVAPLMLTIVLFYTSYFLRTCSAVTLFATLVALLVTGSRGGILSFLVSIFSYLAILYQKKIIRSSTLLSIMITLLIISSVSFVATPSKIRELVLDRTIPTTSQNITEYSSRRLWIWQKALTLFAERPIFGHGFETIIHLMKRRFNFPIVAHNQYLNYLVELGIIGFILFISIYLKIFHIIWNLMKSTPDLWRKKLYISYIAGLLGYASSMLFVNLNLPRYIFWFYTAVILRYGQLQEIGEYKKDGALTRIK